VIIANFMSGKDTHIRGLKICGPEQYVFLLNANSMTFNEIPGLQI